MPLTLSFALLLAAAATPATEGKDEQLDAALPHLQERIREEPVKDLPPPAFPFKAVE